MNIPHITNRQQDILLLLYRFRFLNRLQIQSLLHHKNTKSINTWLKDLTDKKYIERIINNQTKLNNIPAIYYLLLNGIKFLKTQSSCKKEYITKLYKEKTRSEQFINKCLFIADIYLYLLNKYGNTSYFAFYTQSDFTPTSIVKEIFPHFVFRKVAGQPFFVAEIFSGITPRFAIRAKITKYLTFFTQGDWIKKEKVPNILLICPDDKMKKFVVKFTKKIIEEEITDMKFFVTVADMITKQTIEGQIWQKIEKS